jgi:hypothetical protein
MPRIVGDERERRRLDVFERFCVAALMTFNSGATGASISV